MQLLTMASNSKIITFVIVLLAFSVKPGLLMLMKWITSWPIDERIGTIPVLTIEQLKSHYQHKSVLLIGGTRGVGYGTAMTMAKAGAHVTLVGRNVQTGQTACENIHQHTSTTPSSSSYCTFLQGDIGNVNTSMKLINELTSGGGKYYDYLVVSAATFPNWKVSTQIQEDGLDKSWAIAVLGRFLIYRYMNKFIKPNTGRILNVLASGHNIPIPGGNLQLDRDIATGKKQVKTLLEAIVAFSIGNEIMQILLQKHDPNVTSFTRVSTHPGVIQTELHTKTNQGIFFDIFEQIMVWIFGISIEEVGLNQASILANNNLPSGTLSYVGQFMNGALCPKELQTLVNDHGDWLWKHLLTLEAKASL